MKEVLLVKRDRDFHYPIYFEENFQDLSNVLREEGLEGRSFCIVSDSNTKALYQESVLREIKKISENVSVFSFEAGEKQKNLQTVSKLYTFLIEKEMDRKGVLIALGGGVVGDLTGFTAATYLRGIDFVQIPTTLLAQVDSSIGGKTGVDVAQYKNMAGAFHQPRLVYMNLNVLKTLPEVEFSCGMGEILKTGLICDKEFFRFVCDNEEKIHKLEPELLIKMVKRCCGIKASIVERDPKETGERALLNLGHTIGHAVEKLKEFQIRHGQCVGIGLVAAAFLSKERNLLTGDEYKEIRSGLEKYHLPLGVSGLKEKDILAATKKDKKMENGQIKFILMDGIGKSFVDRTVTDNELLNTIQEIII